MEAWLSVSHQGGQGGPCPMYKSPQRKMVVRPEFLPGLGPQTWTPGRASACPWRNGFYKGPLNWFPDRCCRMEGLVLAASPSFLQTTCEETCSVSGGLAPAYPWLHIPTPYRPSRAPMSSQPRSWEVTGRGGAGTGLCPPSQSCLTPK